MARLGTEVTFVLPRPVEQTEGAPVRLVSGPKDLQFDAFSADESDPLGLGLNVEFRAVNAAIRPYLSPEEYQRAVTTETPAPATDASSQTAQRELSSLMGSSDPYGGDLFLEVGKYAAAARAIAREESFEIIHAHDWMTYLAGIAAKQESGRPLVVHVHSTEFDRSGLHVNQQIYDIERAGMHVADRVIAVSHLTKRICVERYGVDPDKVTVVYNAIDDDGGAGTLRFPPIRRDERIVLFLGRITMQKGPEYFISAAKKVLERMENVRFIMAGGGDMARRMIELAAEMGIGHRVLFTGFLRGDDVRKVFRMADLYVMPSVSEPFGIAPLEALANNVPVLISKQSGVAEVLKHALKVDFWDVDEMANKILAVLRHPPLQQTLRDHGTIEVRRFSWTDSAKNCLDVYRLAQQN
jgi:glycosyltransferase involved in cell wall biosynthesis